jgi:hypothetical protein
MRILLASLDVSRKETSPLEAVGVIGQSVRVLTAFLRAIHKRQGLYYVGPHNTGQ